MVWTTVDMIVRIESDQPGTGHPRRFYLPRLAFQDVGQLAKWLRAAGAEPDFDKVAASLDEQGAEICKGLSQLSEAKARLRANEAALREAIFEFRLESY